MNKNVFRYVTLHDINNSRGKTFSVIFRCRLNINPLSALWRCRVSRPGRNVHRPISPKRRCQIPWFPRLKICTSLGSVLNITSKISSVFQRPIFHSRRFYRLGSSKYRAFLPWSLVSFSNNK